MPRTMRRRLTVALCATALLIGFPAASHAAAPDVVITAPAAGSVVDGTIRLTAKAPAANRVDFYLNGVRVASDSTGSSFSEKWDTRRALDGSYRLVAKATNGDGSKMSAPVVFTIGDEDQAVGQPAVGTPPPAPDPVVTPPAPPDPVIVPASFPACAGPGRNVVRPYPPGTTLSSRWQAPSPPADTTYDLTGVTSTAFPSTQYPFSAGTSTPANRTCIVGGELHGTIDPAQTWEHYHEDANASCVKLVAIDWSQIRDTRCDGVEDGFRPQEGTPNSNRTRFFISGTHLSNVADDCLENDYVLGGVLFDNLWESCFTGISERPSSGRSWTPPAGETLVVDHMLIGLRSMPHASSKGTGPNSLFKWSSSGDKVVIKCSVFYVHARSVNGADSMALPPGTVVDDSACPARPSTIVWTGGGSYPGDLRGTGIRVTTDRSVWDGAVAAWKTAH